MSTTKSRYRPAFSEEEINMLHTILMDRYLSETNSSHIPKVFSYTETLIYNQLIGKINTLRTKIANNAINPAYVTTKHSDPKIAQLESLGAPADEVAIASGDGTKEQYWEKCYYKYRSDPNNCAIREINAALEYKYLNDLMTPEEVAAFEFNAEQKENISNG